MGDYLPRIISGASTMVWSQEYMDGKKFGTRTSTSLQAALNRIMGHVLRCGDKSRILHEGMSAGTCCM